MAVETTETSIKIRMGIAREHDPSNEEGTCLWCGRKLRVKCNTEKESTDEYRPPPKGSCWGAREGSGCDGKWEPIADEGGTMFKCSGCDDEHAGNRIYKVKSQEPFFKGGARGDYGDNAFCGLRCGYAFGVTMARLGNRVAPRKG